MKPRISVIITTFKRPQFLGQAIESVLSQSFKNLELVVVNDDPASSEADKIIFSFKDPRLIYLRNKENVGSAKSLNIGLRQAQGDYIAILDDDDMWTSKEKLSHQIQFLDKNPDHVLLGTNMVVVDADSGKEITRSHFPTTDTELRALLFKNNPFAHSSVMFKRKMIVSLGGYDESLQRGKDYDLWLKLAKNGKIAVLPGHFLKYREAISSEINLVRKRYEDAKWTLEVMKRHRRDFSSFSLSQ